MNKTIMTIATAIIVFGGLVWFARPGSQRVTDPIARNNGNLTVEESANFDFGTISMAEGKVKHLFSIKNTGEQSVNIEKMYTSCMCTTALLAIGEKQFGPFGMPGHMAIPRIDQNIEPNKEATVEVVFDPAAHGPAGVGLIQRLVTLENNAGESVELQFSAVVTP